MKKQINKTTDEGTMIHISMDTLQALAIKKYELKLKSYDKVIEYLVKK